MRFRSIRFKSVILYASLLFLILAIFSATLFMSVRYILFRNLDGELDLKALEIAGIIGSSGPFSFRSPVADDLWRMKSESLNLKKDYINVMNLKGQTVVRSANFKGEAGRIFKEHMPFSGQFKFYRNIRRPGYHLRVVNYPVMRDPFFLYIVQVGTSLAPVQQVLNKLLLFILLSMGIVLLLASYLGVFFTRNILKPVKDLARTADLLSHKNLNLRLEGSQVDEEMKFLINSFNSMIDRLERSFRHINEFSHHVAHELNTPLSVMKGEIEVMMRKKTPAREYKKVLASLLEEIDRLHRIVRDILLLAKLEYEQEIYRFEPVDLAAFLKDIAEQGRILASEKKIGFTLEVADEKVRISGDKVHLRRLFFNLIHNAVKYTPAEGRIVMNLDRGAGEAVVGITDTGCGIPREDLPRIFDKFFRSSCPANSRETGIGLGLNISQTVARAHQGRISASSREGKGAAFTVYFPLLNG